MNRIKGLSKTIIPLEGHWDPMEPLIITAAITGGEYVSKAETPYVPCTVDEIVGELDLPIAMPEETREMLGLRGP